MDVSIALDIPHGGDLILHPLHAHVWNKELAKTINDVFAGHKVPLDEHRILRIFKLVVFLLFCDDNTSLFYNTLNICHDD